MHRRVKFYPAGRRAGQAAGRSASQCGGGGGSAARRASVVAVTVTVVLVTLAPEWLTTVRREQ